MVEANMPHPHLTDEIPRVELDSETPGVSHGISCKDEEIEIIEPRQEQLVQSVIHNNSLSVAGIDKTPGATLVNFANDTDNVDSSQDCGVLPKREPKFEVTTDAG